MIEFINLTKVQLYARSAHSRIQQRRKFTGLPYWVHVEEVELLVRTFHGSPAMRAAAFLHDVLEDVMPAIPGFNWTEFKEVAWPTAEALVRELTNVYTKESFPQMSHEERFHRELVRLELISDDAQTIKLADIISNCRDLWLHESEWTRGYLLEKHRMITCRVLSHGDPSLFTLAKQVIEEQLDYFHLP